MKILATDLDRTLLPNGKFEPDHHAIELFNRLTLEQNIFVVYVTGRNLHLTQNAIEEFGVRMPDVLCGDVGTSIRYYREGEWVMDPAWEAHTKAASPRWEASAVKDAIADVPGLREQEAEHLNLFKQSYYVEHEQNEEILDAIRQCIEGKYDETIIYSFDPHNGNGLLDLQPASATKQTSLEFVADNCGVPREKVVFCGDSGNDIFPLTAGFAGVMVRNADEQLVASVQEAMLKNAKIRVYHAKGGFMNLSGYYTSGVLEGAHHYGLLE